MSDPLVLIAVGAALGLVLGLLGGGGGILAVPALVALGEPVLVASTMSLVIVGAGAAAALVPHHRAGRIDWHVGLTFGALGSVGAVVGARAAQTASAAVLLGGLTVMLLVGAYAMLQAARTARRPSSVAEPALVVMAGGAPAPSLTAGGNAPSEPVTGPTSRGRVLTLASGVGLVTGFFGVGAGFVVVPALVSAMRVPIKRATATALVVIVINSAVALVVRHGSLGPLSHTAVLAVATAVFAVVGALVSHQIPGWLLSAAFGALMVAVAVFTVTRAVVGA
jgi:uncharacterized membrane protein YfcA